MKTQSAQRLIGDWSVVSDKFELRVTSCRFLYFEAGKRQANKLLYSDSCLLSTLIVVQF
jgi:hypothetical protein